MRRQPLGFLTWLLAVAVWLTWSPFELRVDGSAGFELDPELDLEAVGHVLLLVPVAVTAVVFTPVSKSLRPYLRAFVAVAFLGLISECGQWWLNARSLSPHDVLFNCIGAALGMGTGVLLIRLGVAQRSILLSVGVLVSLTVQATMISSLCLLNRGTRLSNWDPSYGVLAGNELRGQRPYQGHVWNAEVCAGEPAERICATPGADIETRRRLKETAEKSNRVQITAQVLSTTHQMIGPARIVTFSKGPLVRNATLAQEYQDLVFRIRTPRSGANGSRTEFILPNAVQKGIPVRVTAKFERGVISMRAESSTGTVAGDYYPDFRQNSLRVRGAVLPVIWRGRAGTTGGAVLFASFGLALGWLLRGSWAVAGLVGAVSLVIGLAAVKPLVLAIPPTGAELLLSAIALELGVVLAKWDRRRMQAPDPAWMIQGSKHLSSVLL